MSDCINVWTEPEIQAILETCPGAGEGVNRWFFGAARKLHMLKLTGPQIEEMLEYGASACGRELRADEIPRAVRNSAPGAIRNQVTRRSWPTRNYEMIEEIGQAGIHLAKLEQRSPVRFDDSEDAAEAVIDVLFPGDPMLCGGWTWSSVLTRPREEWRGFLRANRSLSPRR